MPTTPEARAKYLKRRRAKLKKLKDKYNLVLEALNEFPDEENCPVWTDEIGRALDYIMRQARKAL